jgi:hypothetical protein
MEYAIRLVEFYVLGGVIFAAYNVLEISSLHKQHESSRDKNSRNASLALAKSHMSEIAGVWKWPYALVKTSINAMKWVKSE